MSSDKSPGGLLVVDAMEGARDSEAVAEAFTALAKRYNREKIEVVREVFRFAARFSEQHAGPRSGSLAADLEELLESSRGAAREVVRMIPLAEAALLTSQALHAELAAALERKE